MAACFADYTRIAGRARELLILLYLFLAVSPAVLGTSINGSVSWIYLPLTGGTINLSYVQLTQYRSTLRYCTGTEGRG